MWDSRVSLSWTTHICTIPKDQWWGQDRLPRLGAPGYTLLVTEPLPSPYCTWHQAIRPYGAPALPISCGWPLLLILAFVFTPEWLGQPPFLFHELPTWDTHCPMLTWGKGLQFSEVAWRQPPSRVTAGPWWSSCIVTAGGSPDSVRVLVCLSPCSDLPTGGEGADCPLPAPLALSTSMPANPWPLPVLCLVGLLAAPLPTPLPANALFGEEAGFCHITLHTSPPVMLLEEVLILGGCIGQWRQGCLSSGRKHSHYLHSLTRHHSGWVRHGPNH